MILESNCMSDFVYYIHGIVKGIIIQVKYYTFICCYFFSLSDDSIPAIVLSIYVIKWDLIWNWRQFIASDKCTIISLKCQYLMRSWQCNDHKNTLYFWMSCCYFHVIKMATSTNFIFNVLFSRSDLESDCSFTTQNSHNVQSIFVYTHLLNIWMKL